MTEKKFVPGRVTLINVRLSFPTLVKPKTMTRPDGTLSDPKYSCSFLIPKTLVCPYSGKPVLGKHRGETMPIMRALKAAKEEAIEKRVGSDAAKKVRIKPENYCLRDGDLETWDGYEGCHYVSSSNSLAPKLLDSDKSPAPNGRLYAGCRVVGIVTMWHQSQGKSAAGLALSAGVFASLEAVQYFGKGEPFGASPVDEDEDFDDVSGADEGEDCSEPDEDDEIPY